MSVDKWSWLAVKSDLPNSLVATVFGGVAALLLGGSATTTKGIEIEAMV